MKRLTSLACLGFLLLNIMGYYGIFVGIEYQSDQQMLSLLDANTYDESSTVTIKVPISLPYMTDQTRFERVNGKFELNGNVYRLVKQKYQSDTLTIVCIQDHKSREIDQALEAYVRSFSDNPQNAKHEGKISITLIKEYFPATPAVSIASDGWAVEVLSGFVINAFPATTRSVSTPPPQKA